MIEEVLLQYGAMGALALILMYQLMRQQRKDDERQERLLKVVNNNTIALTKVHQSIKKCKR